MGREKKEDINRLITYLRKEGMVIDEDLLKVGKLFWEKKVIATRVFDGVADLVAKTTGVKKGKVKRIMMDLSTLRLLKDLSYEGKITPYAENIIKGVKPDVTGRLKRSRVTLLSILANYLWDIIEEGEKLEDLEGYLPDECLLLVIENPNLIDEEVWKKLGNRLEGYAKILIRYPDRTFELKRKQ